MRCFDRAADFCALTDALRARALGFAALSGRRFGAGAAALRCRVDARAAPFLVAFFAVGRFGAAFFPMAGLRDFGLGFAFLVAIGLLPIQARGLCVSQYLLPSRQSHPA
ncbi:MAG TPA: hypothetical protein VH835_07070 [Dongiaceae bacterium]